MCCEHCDPYSGSTAVPLAELLQDPRVVGLLREEHGIRFWIYVAMFRENRQIAENAGQGLAPETFMAAVGTLLPGITPADFAETCTVLERHKLLLRLRENGQEFLFIPTLAELERFSRERQGSDREADTQSEPAQRAGYLQ